MAISRCPKCGGQSFEAVVKIPIGSPRRVMFVQCSACGAVVGIQEPENSGRVKKPIEPASHSEEPPRWSMKRLDSIKAEVNAIMRRLYN
jgi:uncharacterized Zn finger protein